MKRVIAKGYPFGSRFSWNKEIIHRDTANPHLYAIGGSGSGKTRLLYHLCIQEIEEALVNPGYKTVIVIDPHGDLHRYTLNYIGGNLSRYFISDNVVLIEPVVQTRGAIGINVLEAPAGIHPYETVDEVISCFKAIWYDAWGARMEDILRHAAMLLQIFGLTIVSMPRLLTDAAFREALVDKCEDRDVRLYWREHFGAFKSSEQRYFIESTRNKVSAFISNPYLRPILCQPRSTINFSREMSAGKVILISLSRDHLKTESRRLFGVLLFAGIHQALLARNDQPENQRTPTSIYIDEAHEIFHPDFFLNILEGGRKYKAALNLFHQSLSQLHEDHVDIALGNTATQICFSVARHDAERMSKELFNFSGERIKYQEGGLLSGKKGKPTFYSVQEEVENAVTELMRQKIGQCYIKIKGQNEEPFIASTIKVNYPDINIENEEKLREVSARAYNRPLEDVYRQLEVMEAEIVGNNNQAGEPVSYRE